MQSEGETRNQKFKRLAEQRVNTILDKMRLLGQLANRNNYEYSDRQVEAIFRALQRDLNATKLKFREGTNEQKRFTLS